MAIVDVPTFQDYVRDTLAGVAVNRLSQALAAAEQMVNAHCHRVFVVAGATATARVFVPSSAEMLRVDDFVEATAISNDGTSVTADYQLEPLNGIDAAGNAVPYHQLVRTSGSWTRDGKRATVTVTARWGWPAIPDAVKEALLIFAKDIAWQRELKGDVAGFSDFGAVRIRSNPLAAGLLHDFVRWDRNGIA